MRTREVWTKDPAVAKRETREALDSASMRMSQAEARAIAANAVKAGLIWWGSPGNPPRLFNPNDESDT